MTPTRPKNPPIFGTILFCAIALAVAAASVWAGWSLYVAGARTLSDFYARLGDLVLELGVVAIGGAFLKILHHRSRHINISICRCKWQSRLIASGIAAMWVG